MSDSEICKYPQGEEQFKQYEADLTPGKILYPGVASSGSTNYGVMVHRPAHEWEIVAVQGNRPRHVVFVSAAVCLDRVLELAAELSGAEQPV